MRPSLALVSSPFQLLCLIEFIGSRCIDSLLTICLDEDLDLPSSTQIKELLNYLNVNEIITIKMIYGGDLKDRIDAYAKPYRNSLNKDWEYVFIGDIRHQWMQDIACATESEKVIIVDDGAATLANFDYIYKVNNYKLPVFLHNGSPERKQEALNIKKQQGLMIKEKKVRVFSVFDELDSELKNDFSYLKKVLTGNYLSEENTWHFLGSPVVEKDLIDLNRYLNILSDSIERNKPFGKPIYFFHRSENVSHKLELIKELGFDIIFNDMPYELYMLKQHKTPKAIASLHSTSLFNAKNIFHKKIPCFCYRLPHSSLESLVGKYAMHDIYDLNDHVQSIYKRMKSYGIEIITLE